jgi:hypothetical protein
VAINRHEFWAGVVEWRLRIEEVRAAAARVHQQCAVQRTRNAEVIAEIRRTREHLRLQRMLRPSIMRLRIIDTGGDG